MKHYLFSGNESPEEAKRILVDNAEGSELMTYTKQLTDEELAEMLKNKKDEILKKELEACTPFPVIYK